MDLQEVGCDWIKLAQERDICLTLVNVVTNLWVPQNFLTSCKMVSFSRGTFFHGISKEVLFNVCIGIALI
jgi:hypothetical protein